MVSSHDLNGIVVPKSLATLEPPFGEEESTMKDTTIFIGIAKSIFEIVVVTEACGMAHHWGARAPSARTPCRASSA